MHFKLSALVTPLLFTAGALGQATVINSPQSGATLANGQSFTFQVLRPMSHQGSVEVGYAIGLNPCGTSPCAPPTQQVGRIIYNGPYRPQLLDRPGQPYQNFTLTIPPTDEFPKGPAQINTVRLHMIGGGPFPIFEALSVPIIVV